MCGCCHLADMLRAHDALPVSEEGIRLAASRSTTRTGWRGSGRAPRRVVSVLFSACRVGQRIGIDGSRFVRRQVVAQSGANRRSWLTIAGSECESGEAWFIVPARRQCDQETQSVHLQRSGPMTAVMRKSAAGAITMFREER